MEFQAGGQFYPVLTGRLDSQKAFPEQAKMDLPGPDFDIAQAVQSFADKGFNPREMVALLGCKLKERLRKVLFFLGLKNGVRGDEGGWKFGRNIICSSCHFSATFLFFLWLKKV